jgi:hypothetical protein
MWCGTSSIESRRTEPGPALVPALRSLHLIEESLASPGWKPLIDAVTNRPYPCGGLYSQLDLFCVR